jgi:hypothetical protein
MPRKIKPTAEVNEKDGVYVLKLILFFVLGCLWIQLGGDGGVPIPVGLVFGIALTLHEHFIVDRKIEYLVLIIATVLSFIEPIGFVLNIG